MKNKFLTIFISISALFLSVFSVMAIEISVQELSQLLGEEDISNYGAYTGMVDGENYNVGVRIFNGNNYNRLIASTSLSSDITWSLPILDGSSGQFLSTNGNGVLSFATAGTPALTLGNIFVGNSSNEATATTTIFITNELVGIGTTTPLRTLDVFGTLGVSGATTLNGVAYTWPASDGTTDFSLTTNGAGQLSWSDVSKASTSDTVVFNTTANEAITKGDAVYVSGELAGLPLVNLADADDSTKMPALGLAATTVASGSALQIIQTGRLTGFDTSSFTAGDALYVATSSGALVNYRPSASNELVQKIAQVENSDVSGNIIIFGAGRSNDVPNTFTVNSATSTDFTVTGDLKAGTVISGTWNGSTIDDNYLTETYLTQAQGTSTYLTKNDYIATTTHENIETLPEYLVSWNFSISTSSPYFDDTSTTTPPAPIFDDDRTYTVIGCKCNAGTNQLNFESSWFSCGTTFATTSVSIAVPQGTENNWALGFSAQAQNCNVFYKFKQQ